MRSDSNRVHCALILYLEKRVGGTFVKIYEDISSYQKPVVCPALVKCPFVQKMALYIYCMSIRLESSKETAMLGISAQNVVFPLTAMGDPNCGVTFLNKDTKWLYYN